MHDPRPREVVAQYCGFKQENHRMVARHSLLIAAHAAVFRAVEERDGQEVCLCLGAMFQFVCKFVRCANDLFLGDPKSTALMSEWAQVHKSFVDEEDEPC